MLFRLFRAHIVLLLRTIKDVGLIRIILLGTVGIPMVSLVLRPLLSIEDAVTQNSTILLGFLLILLIIHVRRKDRFFIRNLPINPFYFYALEYGLAAVPVFIILLFCNELFFAFGLIPGVLLLSLTDKILPSFSSNSITKPFVRLPWFHGVSFELNSGLRRVLWFLPVLYLIHWKVGYYAIGSSVGIVLLGFIIAAMYGKCESISIIQGLQLTSLKMLWKKISNSWLLLTILSIPLLTLHFIYEDPLTIEIWYPCFALVGSLLLIQTAVLAKYLLFQEGKDISMVHTILLFPAALILFIPYTTVLGLFGMLVMYILALRKLNTHRHA